MLLNCDKTTISYHNMFQNVPLSDIFQSKIVNLLAVMKIIQIKIMIMATISEKKEKYFQCDLNLPSPTRIFFL